jgi:5-methylcytosine-specific restriction endonuclease McrA
MLTKVKRIKVGPRVYGRLVKKVLERDQWRCQKCGSLENLQIHHKVKRSQQGNDALQNLVTLCAYCHLSEHGQLSYGPGVDLQLERKRSRTDCGQALL